MTVAHRDAKPCVALDHKRITLTVRSGSEPKSTVAEASEAVKGTAHRIGAAIDKGRKPGMPLSILSNIAREAPLASLLVAFLLGVAVARRR